MMGSPSSTEDAEDVWSRRLLGAGRAVVIALFGVTPVLLGSVQRPGPNNPMFGMWDSFGLPKLVFSMVCIALLVIICCALVHRGNLQRLRWHPVLWVAIGYLVWSGIATLAGVSPRDSILGRYGRWDGLTADAIYVLIMLLVPQFIRSRRDVLQIAAAIVAGGALVGAYALVQRVGLDPMDWSSGGFKSRVFATFGNPNMLGDFLVVPLTVALGLGCVERRERPMLLYFASAQLCGVALLLSGTRGAWLAEAVAVTVLALYLVRAKWRPDSSQRLALGVLVVSMAAMLVMSVPGVVDRSAGSGGQSSSVAADNDRFAIWELGLEAGIRRPVVGWGPGAFKIATQGSERAALSAVMHSRWQGQDNAHNYPIHTLVATGFVGLALMMAVVLWTLWSSRRAMAAPVGKLDNAAVAVFWAAAAGSFTALLTGVSGFTTVVWLWMCLAVLVAAQSRQGREIAPATRLVVPIMAIAVAALALVACASTVYADTQASRGMRSVPREAVSHLDRAYRINPLVNEYWQLAYEKLWSHANELREIGADVAVQREVLEEFFARLEEGIARNPMDLHRRLVLVNVLADTTEGLGDPQFARRAIVAGREAGTMAPAHWMVPDAMASVYAALGDDARVAEYREKTLRLAPDDVDAKLRKEWGTSAEEENPSK